MMIFDRRIYNNNNVTHAIGRLRAHLLDCSSPWALIRSPKTSKQMGSFSIIENVLLYRATSEDGNKISETNRYPTMP